MNSALPYRIVLFLLGVLLTAVGLLACGAVTGFNSSIPTLKPDIPRRDEEYAKLELYDHLFDEFHINEWWASPMLPMNKWSANYQGRGIWLVRVYGVDKNYAGTWSVPESGEIIEPWDELARESVASREFVKLPTFPPGVILPGGTYKEYMVQAVQSYIAGLSPAQVSEAEVVGLAELRLLIRKYFPIEWDVKYDSSTWQMTATSTERAVYVFIEPESGRILPSSNPIWRYCQPPCNTGRYH